MMQGPSWVKSVALAVVDHFRCAPINGHLHTGSTGPFGAESGTPKEL